MHSSGGAARANPARRAGAGAAELLRRAPVFRRAALDRTAEVIAQLEFGFRVLDERDRRLLSRAHDE
jgi:hypothetical protein